MTSQEKATAVPGIPTATNVDHVGWTVANLDDAVDFCADVLGGELILAAGPFADPMGDWMATQFDVSARASARIALMRLGPAQVIELLEWTTDESQSGWPRTSDFGASHLAIHVTDVDAALSYLVEHGCEPCGEPALLSDVPHAGVTILYVRTPIGLYLELVSQPGSPLPYESATDARLLRPATAWTDR